MAVLAIQMQALPNLLPADQAERLRSRVLSFLSPEEVGTKGIESVQAYEQAWTAAIAESVNLPYNASLPSSMIASTSMRR